MAIKEQLYDAFHILITRRLIGPLEKRKYGHFGDTSRVYRPIASDKNRKNVYIGNNTIIGKDSRIQCFPKEDKSFGRVIIGNNCRMGNRLSILCGADVAIEDYVLIASDVLIASENHSINPEDSFHYMSQQLTCKEVRIKEGCWIGEKVCILPGVTIGKKSVIGAGSVVTKSVDDYCIAVGNPAKVIKRYSFEKHAWNSI